LSSPTKTRRAEQLRKVREFRGLSIKDLASRSGVSSAAISQWENGKHKPRFEQLKKVLDALNITHEQLYQDFDVVFVREAIEKFQTGAKDVEVVLTADPALSPSDVEIIMHIVLAKERELIEKEKKPE